MDENDKMDQQDQSIIDQGIADTKRKVTKEANKLRKKIMATIKRVLIPMLLAALKILLPLLAIIGIIALFNSILDGGSSGTYDEDVFHSTGRISTFGCELSREEFIEAVEAYNGGSDYDTYMVPYAGDFYDICTEDDINPCLAFAHACVETGFGSSAACKNNKNYFGMAHYNTAESGTVYSSVEDSITAYCKWVIDASTEGTDSYNSNYEVGQEYAEYNEKLAGTPDNNIYVLYCRYAYLGDTHCCDEPNFDSPAGIEYYKSNGSNWGTGGRIIIYSMYEEGGLYTGKYKELCGHSKASDPTSTQERADYAEYSTNLRINVAKNIFGANCFGSFLIQGNGNIVETAVKCHAYLRTNGYTYAQAGITVPDGVLSGKTIDCSSYVTWVLYEAGMENMKGYQQTSYTFYNNSWGWQQVNVNEAIPGDILVYDGHVEIVANNDGSQNYRVYSCGGNYEINTTGTAEFPESTQAYYSKSQVIKVLRPPINSKEGEV